MSNIRARLSRLALNLIDCHGKVYFGRKSSSAEFEGNGRI
jgi:hypothetical protein